MKDIKAMMEAYKRQDYMHQKPAICHSINTDNYNILCQKFFAVSSNRQEYINMAEEANLVCNQAEQKIILWLNGEWEWL